MVFRAILGSNFDPKENSMEFKKTDPYFTFADLALKDSIQLNIPTKFATQFNRINGSNLPCGATGSATRS